MLVLEYGQRTLNDFVEKEFVKSRFGRNCSQRLDWIYYKVFKGIDFIVLKLLVISSPISPLPLVEP